MKVYYWIHLRPDWQKLVLQSPPCFPLVWDIKNKEDLEKWCQDVPGSRLVRIEVELPEISLVEPKTDLTIIARVDSGITKKNDFSDPTWDGEKNCPADEREGE